MNNRNFTVLGAGTFIALVMIFLPMPLGTRFASAILTMIVFVLIAFGRWGGDRSPIETFLVLKVINRKKTKKFSHHGGGVAAMQAPAAVETQAPRRTRKRLPALTFTMEIKDEWVYQIARLFLLVIIFYLAAWFMGGGAEQSALDFNQIFPGFFDILSGVFK